LAKELKYRGYTLLLRKVYTSFDFSTLFMLQLSSAGV